MSDPIGCADVRARLGDLHRGRLDAAGHADVAAHLERCPGCAHEDAAEQALTEVLERRLPQYSAPLALKRRLTARWAEDAADRPGRPSPREWWNRWGRSLVPAAAVALVLLAVIPLYYRPAAPGSAQMVAEAVNDHLRILLSQNPLDVKSGGIHQVKPWFEGRLDFAPVVTFGGDADFPLEGGAVGYFLDRKAAVFVFHRRLHVVTLFVFRADGLAWPARGLEAMGTARAYASAARGFNVLLWRENGLGYALVSDVDRADLARLGARIAGGA